MYHKTVHQVFENINGVSTVADDIVFGATREPHDSSLRQVFDKAGQVNLKLNKAKCKLGMYKKLTFIGDLITSKGLLPDPRKVSAINNMTNMLDL